MAEEKQPGIHYDVDKAVKRIKAGPVRKIYKMGLDKFVCHNESQIKTWTAIDFVNEIDKAICVIEKHMNVLRTKKGPKTYAMIYYDIENEFGSWSSMITRNIRQMLVITTKLIDRKEKVNENMKLHEQFSWAYSYWWNRFSYLRTVVKSRSKWGGISQKKRIEKARVTLKKLITGEIDPSGVSAHFHKLVQDIKMGVTLNKEYQELEKQWGSKDV